MPIDFDYIKKRFEKSMQDYDNNALVQKNLAKKMTKTLTKFENNFDNILELGVGTGILTKCLSSTLIYNNYFGNDLIEKSEKFLKNVIPDANFTSCNALELDFSTKMDLIISNAMFQWFDDIKRAISLIKKNLKKGGYLTFSTFAPDNFFEFKSITGLTLDYKSIDELKNILTTLGFEVLYCENYKETLYFNTSLEILFHMKKTGVNSLNYKNWNIKEIKNFCDEYNKQFDKPQLTYSPIIIIAKLVK